MIMVPYSFIASRLYRAAATRGARVAISQLPPPTTALTHYSTTSTMHDNNPEILELEKKRNLSKTQHLTSTPHAHAPGWNEPLATESEASVKADKGPESDVDLQARTVEYIRARHSPDDRVETTTATYAREEVVGPLSGAKGKEDPCTDANSFGAHSIQRPLASTTVDAFSAGGESTVQGTVVEEVTEVRKERKIKKDVPGENPTPSEEAVRAEQGKEIIV